jgi:hypothetical protein
MFKLILLLSFTFLFKNINGQPVQSVREGKYFTKAGKISLFSKTALENIDATNKSTACILDSKSGEIQFGVLMKSFEFKKALMQEDFNKNFIESKKFPKAEFSGQLTNNAEIKYTTDGTYTTRVKGKLTLHGITKDLETSGIVVIKSGKISVSSTFNILLTDYNIKVPKVQRSQISDTIKITVECNLEPLKS